jgi:hypothetical protein
MESEANQITVEIPVRMLHVSALAAKEPGRYMQECVLVESRPDNVVALIATDGRRLIVAESNKGLFDGDGSILIPADIAKAAAKLAKAKTASGDDEPMAEIRQDNAKSSITVFGGEGDVVFNWESLTGQFPPYRDVIPDWSSSSGIARIGVTPELVASALKTLEKISGMDAVRVFLPPKDNAPIGFEAFSDELGITTLALVCPATVDGWKVQKIKAEKKPAAVDTAQVEFDPETGEVKADAPIGVSVSSGGRTVVLTPKVACPHDRVNMAGKCQDCGADTK